MNITYEYERKYKRTSESRFNPERPPLFWADTFCYKVVDKGTITERRLIVAVFKSKTAVNSK